MADASADARTTSTVAPCVNCWFIISPFFFTSAVDSIMGQGLTPAPPAGEGMYWGTPPNPGQGDPCTPLEESIEEHSKPSPRQRLCPCTSYWERERLGHPNP